MSEHVSNERKMLVIELAGAGATGKTHLINSIGKFMGKPVINYGDVDEIEGVEGIRFICKNQTQDSIPLVTDLITVMRINLTKQCPPSLAAREMN